MKTKHEDMIKMIEMRKKGATYAEIAKVFGISRQRVCQKFAAPDKSFKRIRGHGFRIDTIIYRGIYEHFEKDRFETISSFAQKIYGCTGGAAISLIRNFITGASNSRLTIQQIQRICEVTGKSFEETFELRNKKV